MTPSKTRLDAATALRKRMVDRLLKANPSGALLLRHLGVIRAQFEYFEPDATVDEVFEAILEAYDNALDNARWADAHGGGFPRGDAALKLDVLLPEQFVMATVAMALHGPRPEIAARYGQSPEQAAALAEVSSGLREALK